MQVRNSAVKMNRLILSSVFCLQIVLGYGVPDTSGVGAFAYQDSAGNRYGGTYGLRDGQVVDAKGNFPPNFHPNTFQDLDDFFPEYFRNLESLLQDDDFMRRVMKSPGRRFSLARAFDKNLESQNRAFSAAKKAFDLTSNQAGYLQNFNYRFPPIPDFTHFGGFPEPLPFPAMPNFGNDYSAYAAAAARPGYSHQIAAINPANPDMPNINRVNEYSEPQSSDGRGEYRSVSSSSYSSSSNVNGQVKSSRGAETVVNDNGKITKYKVTN